MCYLEKNRRDCLLNWAKEMEIIFKNVEKKRNENNLSQRIRYWFPKRKTIDHLEKMFLFELETYKDQEFAETYAAGLFVVNRLQDSCDRDPPVQ